MSFVAQITTEGELTDLSQVLTEFDEDNLTVERETDSPATDIQTIEVRTNEGEVLTQFHEACVEHNIRLNIRRISHETGTTKRLAAAEAG